jgi:hypothetical protein
MSVSELSESAANAGLAGEVSNPQRWKAMVLLAFVQFMFALDGTIVNVALPTIKTSLGFSQSGLAWVVNGYTLVAGGFLIVGGRAADLFGRRRLFIIGTIIFTIASAVSGLAQSSGMLVGARFAQGLGEALASPAALSLVVLLFTSPVERAKAIGAWGPFGLAARRQHGPGRDRDVRVEAHRLAHRPRRRATGRIDRRLRAGRADRRGPDGRRRRHRCRVV